ncbi:MAG: hypothetical protein R3D66_00845 [Alphaproteobacteria bacterium]
MLDHTKAQLNRKTIGSSAVLNFDLNDFKSQRYVRATLPVTRF